MPYAYLTFLIAALMLIQCMIGGVRLAYSFPAYALVGLAAAASFIAWRRPTARTSPWCLGSALLLAGYIVIRAWFSPNAYMAQADAYMAVACLLVYLLTSLYLPRTIHRNWIVGALLVVALMHATVGAIQFKDTSNFMLFGFSRDASLSLRASGMLDCPDKLAGFLEAIAFLALGCTFWGRWNLAPKLFLGYLALFCFVGVGISGSRGGYLSSLVGLLVFAGLSVWVVNIFNYRRFVFAVMGALLAMGIFVGTSLFLIQKSVLLDQRLHEIGSSRDARWYSWLATMNQFKSHPILGSGAGTNFYYRRLYRPQQLQEMRPHPNNDYLEMLAEYGIVGGALAVFFLVAHIAQGLACARRVTVRRLSNIPGMGRSHTLALTIGAMSGAAALLAHSFVDSNLHVPGNAMLFAFLCAILGSKGIDTPSDDRPERVEAFSRKALVVAGVGLLIAFAFRYPAEYLAERSRLALEQGKYETCARLAGQAAQKNSTNPHLYFYKGEACRMLGSNVSNTLQQKDYLKQAIESYRSGLQCFPQSENFWVRLGQCLDATSNFSEAQNAYLSAIANDPNFGMLYAYYGAHLRLVGDTRSAQKCEATAKLLCAHDVEKIGIGEPPTLLNASLGVFEKPREILAESITP